MSTADNDTSEGEPNGVVATLDDVVSCSIAHCEEVKKSLFSATVVMFWVDITAKSGRTWTVKRRFSEFVMLHKLMAKRFKECEFPSISSRSVKMENRMAKLNAFLSYVMQFPEFSR